MKSRMVWLEPSRDQSVAVGLGANVHYLSRDQATELRRQLGEVLDAEEELPTRRDTPLAMAQVRDTDPAPRTTSSAGFKAVTVDDIFKKAKGEPPPSQGKP